MAPLRKEVIQAKHLRVDLVPSWCSEEQCRNSVETV